MERLLHESRLPLEKTWPALDLKRLPARVVQQARTLLEGSFLDRCENVLVFGQPGSGKTHLLSAIGQELVRAGRKVLFRKCGLLVQELLAAKRDLKLPRLLKQMAGHEALILDDLGYVQQSREEMEVLFLLLAERYRARQRAALEQSAVQRLGGDLQGCDDDGGGDRPAGASQRDRRVERVQLPSGAGEESQARPADRGGRNVA